MPVPIHYILPFIILLLGALDDLKTKKIHNSLILASAGLVLFAALPLFYTPWGPGFWPAFALKILPFALVKGLLAFVMTMPLVLLKVIGGGDMKLYTVLGFLAAPKELVWSLLFAFVWAGLLGLIKSLFDQNGKQLLKNFWNLIQFKKITSDKLNTFPFSVGLLFGWMTAVVYLGG